ncbi:hypothetical protein CBM2609_B120153 [Cupriavidus taiwanensis]|nr:hypothetical protein CBM2604_B130154 [Cupriavidus taiwanensis]SOZ31194.1 hypothetical protein CBM2609_B120153 [Cupriavidus taiwanensis]SOZ47271.1 hypothetical protein CBM2610_B100153 [Cupriavidus taiwanensis]SPA02177.1 hypothetical protein CBM2626_B140075 [Cupriavidus taiwanensis]
MARPARPAHAAAARSRLPLPAAGGLGLEQPALAGRAEAAHAGDARDRRPDRAAGQCQDPGRGHSPRGAAAGRRRAPLSCDRRRERGQHHRPLPARIVDRFGPVVPACAGMTVVFDALTERYYPNGGRMLQFVS